MRRTLRPLAALAMVALISAGCSNAAHLGTTQIIGGTSWKFSRWSALSSVEPEYWAETLLIGEEDSVGRAGGPGRRGYSAGFRRRVVDLLAAGRKVADVARDPGIGEQTIYGWRRQEQIGRGLEPGLSTVEEEGLAAAKRRIHELEAELAVHRRAAELLKETTNPKVASRPSA
jgi:transposase